jgi:hypothetical protein
VYVPYPASRVTGASSPLSDWLPSRLPFDAHIVPNEHGTHQNNQEPRDGHWTSACVFCEGVDDVSLLVCAGVVLHVGLPMMRS